MSRMLSFRECDVPEIPSLFVTQVISFLVFIAVFCEPFQAHNMSNSK